MVQKSNKILPYCWYSPAVIFTVFVLSHSVVFDSVTPRTVANQPPLSMGFSRQEYWSGSPFPSPGYLPHPGIKSMSPALQADSLPTKSSGKQNWSRKALRYCPIRYSAVVVFTVGHRNSVCSLPPV